MFEPLSATGLPELFLLSLLASSLLPLGSEWLLVLLLSRGTDPLAAVLTATVGNSLGACTTWAIGRWCSSWLAEKVLRLDQTSRQRAEDWYRRWGCWSLLLSWLPVVGDPLCLVSGTLHTRFWLFLPLVVVGKFGRYLVIALAAMAWQ